MMHREVKNMKEKLRRFMMGRYGMDDFSKLMIGIAVIFWIANMFIGSRILYSLSMLLMFYVYYRMFSRNIQKRYKENQKFLSIKTKFLSWFKRGNSNTPQSKTHRIYKCPTCKQKIRVPRGKGRILITCPKCKTEFTKIS